MFPFLVRRILWAIALFLATTVITYLIFFIIPADPAALACGKAGTPADAARLLRALTLAMTHPMLVGEPVAPPEIVNLFLHGVGATESPSAGATDSPSAGATESQC